MVNAVTAHFWILSMTCPKQNVLFKLSKFMDALRLCLVNLTTKRRDSEAIPVDYPLGSVYKMSISLNFEEGTDSETNVITTPGKLWSSCNYTGNDKNEHALTAFKSYQVQTFIGATKFSWEYSKVTVCLFIWSATAKQPEKVPLHPIAPRLNSGLKEPHIGPHAYKELHRESLGHESDKWWAKVRLLSQVG